MPTGFRVIEADSTYTAAYGSRPSASNDGDLFFPSDGFFIDRDTGSAWVPWGPIYPFTAPVDGDFSWENQGTSTVSSSYGGVLMDIPTSVGFSMRIRYKSAPSTPYTITAAFIPQYHGSYYYNYGLCWRQSSDGKLVTASIWKDTAADTRMRVYKATDSTTYSADYQYNVTFAVPPLFIRITDDGSDRYVYTSNNGVQFHQLHTVGRTDFLTADQVGWFVNVYNQAFKGACVLASWKET